MSTCTPIQGVLFLMLVAGAMIFPLNPPLGFLLAAGALGLSSLLPAGLGEGLELVMFYGALAGIVVSCF